MPEIRYQPNLTAKIQDNRYPNPPEFIMASGSIGNLGFPEIEVIPSTGLFEYEGEDYRYYGVSSEYTSPSYFDLELIGRNVFAVGDWTLQRFIRMQVAMWARQDQDQAAYLTALDGRTVQSPSPRLFTTLNLIQNFTYTGINGFPATFNGFIPAETIRLFWPFHQNPEVYYPTVLPWYEVPTNIFSQQFPVAWTPHKVSFNECSARIDRVSTATVTARMRVNPSFDISYEPGPSNRFQLFNNELAGFATAGGPDVPRSRAAIDAELAAYMAGLENPAIAESEDIVETLSTGPYGSQSVLLGYRVTITVTQPAPNPPTEEVYFYPAFYIGGTPGLGEFAATHNVANVPFNRWDITFTYPANTTTREGVQYMINNPWHVIVPNQVNVTTQPEYQLFFQNTAGTVRSRGEVKISSWYDTQLDVMVEGDCTSAVYYDENGDEVPDNIVPTVPNLIDDEGNVCDSSSGGFPIGYEDYFSGITWPGGTVVIPGGTTYTLRDGSDAPLYPLYTGAYVYDTHLNKWGVYKGLHKQLLDYSPVNTYQPSEQSYARFGIMGGILKADGFIAVFDERPVDSYITYGKVGYYRQGMTTMEEVRVHHKVPVTSTVAVHSSVEGKILNEAFINQQTFPSSVMMQLNGSMTAKWHNITISGNYDITHLEFRGFVSGRR